MPNAGDLGRQELGRHLRRARHALGWTLDSLADRLGNEGVSVDPSTLSRIEKGRLPIDLNVASALSRCLGTSVSALDEILRSARRRKAIDLTGWDFDGLLAAGKEEVSKGDIYGALDYFEAARDWVELQPQLPIFRENLARALILCASGHLRLRNYIVAQELNRRALNLEGLSHDTKLTALLTEVMIGFYSLDFSRADAYAGQAESMMPTAGDRARAFGFAVLGDSLFFREDFAGAVPWLEKARDLLRHLGNDRELSRVLITIGYCLHRLGHTTNGLRITQDALHAAEKAGFHEVASLGLRFCGRIQLDRKNGDDARSCFRRAQQLARRQDLVHDEFLAYFYQWKWAVEFGTRTEVARCLKAMRSLLPQADRSAPEARELVAALRAQDGEGRTGR